jgi:MoxR-like ATPase
METTDSSIYFQQFSALKTYLNERILGQEKLIDRLLIALIADGHLLVEGAPGLAKTTAIKVLATCIEGSFHRIQFTPDLLPADLTGTDVFKPQDSTFFFQEGPLFHSLLLADEINRAPAKVQSALLEAMGEKQITVGHQTYALPALFLVMATQNPIEQEGTYPLPEAQLDRFLMFISIHYPDATVEKNILQLNRAVARTQTQPPQDVPHIQQDHIFAVRELALNLFLSPALEEYMVQLVIATREPLRYGDDLHRWIRYGASPRGTIGLDRCARAHAFLMGRDYVSPADIHAIAVDVLQHRLVLSFEAQAEGITAQTVIETILKRVPVP